MPNNLYAIASNLEHDVINAIVMGLYTNLTEGMKAKCIKGRVFEVPVNRGLFGEIVNTVR